MKRPLAVIAAVVFFILPAFAAPAKDKPLSHPRSAAKSQPDELYSQRALRRARLIAQLRLLELRKAELDRVEEALRCRLGAAGVLATAAPTRKPQAHPSACPAPFL